MENRAVIRAVLVAVSSGLLAGCAGLAGQQPTEVPSPAIPASYIEARDSLPTESPVMMATWWRSFDDPTLSALIDDAATANTDIRIAESRVREARAMARQSGAGQFPTLDGGASVTGQSEAALSNPGSPTNSGLFNAGFDAVWEADLFGGRQREIDAAEAGVRVEEERRRDVMVSLFAELADTYVSLRATQERLGLTDESLRLQRRTRDLVRQQAGAGIATALDAERADAAVSQLEAQRPRQVAQVDRLINQLSVLLDQRPGALRDRLIDAGPMPVSTAGPEIGVPADLLRRRPDLRAAEQELVAAVAQTDVAVADLYPSLTIPGSISLSMVGLGTGALVETLTATIGAALSIPIFDGGRRQAAVDASEERVEQALLSYRGQILTAMQEVEDALIAYDEALETREALRRNVATSQRAVRIATDLFEQGLSSFLDVLDAQRELSTARQSLAESEEAMSRAMIQLYKALGGGWDPNTPTGTPTGPAARGASS